MREAQKMSRCLKAGISSNYFKYVTSQSKGIEFDDVHLKYIEIPVDIKLEAWKKANFELDIALLDPYLIGRVAKSIPLSLKWVQCSWAGVEHLSQCTDDDRKSLSHCIVTRCGGFGQTIADYVLGSVISMEKQFPQQKTDQANREWQSHKYRKSRLLSTLSIGILGLGNIGCEIARLCNNARMTVYGMKRTQTPAVSEYHVKKIFQPHELPKLLACSDYVCNILPSTPETRGLLSGDVLRHCRERRSKFINVGRGDVINESSLLFALKSGWISEAFLDVFEKEPPDANSLLWEMKNIHITPHIAGISTQEIVTTEFFANLKNFVENKPLSNIFDWDRGY